MGTQNGHNVPFLESASLKKRKRKAMKRIEQIHKISEKGNNNKKTSGHLVPKVVIDLIFEGRKVEGSRKCKRRERVPKAGSRREETITEPIKIMLFPLQMEDVTEMLLSNKSCIASHLMCMQLIKFSITRRKHNNKYYCCPLCLVCTMYIVRL